MWYIYRLNHFEDGGLAYWDITSEPAYFFYEDANIRRVQLSPKVEDWDNYRLEWFDDDTSPAPKLVSLFATTETSRRLKAFGHY